jgi:ABC-type multidrug transport system ATPase subunit
MEPAAMADMIVGRRLCKRFGDHIVLDDVSLSIDRGERVAVIGMNGAGKTTLFRCLLGVTRFTGQLTVGGADVRKTPRAARAKIGYVPQRAPQFDGTLGETMDFFTELRGADPTRVTDYLKVVGLDNEAERDKPVRALSGGMLQKVLLGLALGAGVDVLLLDEPTANLDPRARREFLRALREVPTDTTVILSSHRLADVEAVAQRVLVLHGGGFAFDGQLNELTGRISDRVTVWLRIPREDRDRAQERLQTLDRVELVIGSNGVLGVSASRGVGADVVHQLRAEGLTIEDFWIEGPTLEEHLERLLEPGGAT